MYRRTCHRHRDERSRRRVRDRLRDREHFGGGTYFDYALIVPLLVGGKLGVEDYFQLVDCWVDGLLAAAERKGLLEIGSVDGGPE